MAGDIAGASDVRVLQLVIPSDVNEIERVVELIRRECELMQFGDRQLMLNVPVALTEALSNAIRYGNAQDPLKQVRVHARIDRNRMVVEVTDEGTGFDMDACTVDPTTPEHLENEDGRGLFLMQKLMDRVERFSGDPGNVVRLTLQRAS
jgi:serine/threonine-protein kinase RsbW